MGMPAMNKVHHFARAIWEHEPATLACKRLRQLAPKITTTTSDTFDLKSFIRPESGPRKPGSSDHHKKECAQGGGTRWNPTQEQIGILEMLYRDGMRTPNAQQIEYITARLAKYGKIEGKNVFYWFQNHKARERQKLKRNSLPLISPQPSPSTSSSLFLSLGEGGMEEELGCVSQKRKCRSWAFDQCLAEDIRFYNQEYEEDEEEEGEDRTLKLFPLHPERR